MRILLKIMLLYFNVVIAATATTVSNEWSGLMGGLSYSLRSFTQNHRNQLPQDWHDLDPYFDPGFLEKFEIRIGAPISSKLVYFRESPPTIRQPPVSLIAMTAFLVINEEKSPPAYGRYMITRDRNGSFAWSWEYELNIQEALAKVGITSVPSGPVFNQAAPDPFPGVALMDDALAHGVAFEVAAPIIEAHINEFMAGREKKAKTWTEIAPGSLASAPISQPTAGKAATQKQKPASTFKWLVGALVMVATLGLGFRWFSRK